MISNSDDNKDDKKSIKIKVPSDVAKGQYCNVMINNFSKEEFILDFALIQPHTSEATVCSRVILTPRNAKKLVSMLETNIKQYESQCGPISEDSQPGNISISFN